MHIQVRQLQEQLHENAKSMARLYAKEELSVELKAKDSALLSAQVLLQTWYIYSPVAFLHYHCCYVLVYAGTECSFLS